MESRGGGGRGGDGAYNAVMSAVRPIYADRLSSSPTSTLQKSLMGTKGAVKTVYLCCIINKMHNSSVYAQDIRYDTL